MNTTTRRNRTRTATTLPAGLIAGLLGAAVLALSMNGTVSALTAKITNDTNTAGVAGVTMQEFGYTAGVVNTTPDCDTSTAPTNIIAACNYNKYGNDHTMLPGTMKATKVRIKNSSTTTAAGLFTAKFDPCTALKKVDNTAGNATLCDRMRVTIKATQMNGATTVVAEKTIIPNQTATQLATTGTYVINGAAGLLSTTPLPAGHHVDLTFEVTADNAIDNTNMNTYIKQPITWEFTA